MSTQTEIAVLILLDAHKGQHRHDGVTPYHVHPLRVGNSLLNYGDNVAAAGYLHDVLEDTDWTVQKLLDEGINKEVISIVKILTKKPNEHYRQYLCRVKANDEARVVKVADMVDNISDCPSQKQKDKYRNGIIFLSTKEDY